jgi:SAM-dependent methyltransferase
MNVPYTDNFYAETEDVNLSSSSVIVPIILDFVAPKSVIDVGCGHGYWLKSFAENGVTDIFGVDASWIQEKDLVIPKDAFAVRDLASIFSIDRTADLVLSLEVAEHLDASAANSFVSALTTTAPVVLFSSAIPFQGGTHHVNEQWPAYWEEKFRSRCYVPVDLIRRRVWNDENVSFYYAQNMLLYVKESELCNYPKLKNEIQLGFGTALPLVHPKMHLYLAGNSERWKIIEPYINKLPLPLLRKIKRLMSNWLDRK